MFTHRARLRLVHVPIFLLGAGLFAGAVAGGGLKAGGAEVPVIGSVARQVGLAVAGLIVAAFAFRRESDGPGSDEGREALALAMKPRIEAGLTISQVGGSPPRSSFMVNNVSDFDAMEVDVEVCRRNGRRYHSHTERLAAHSQGANGFPADIGEPTAVYEADMKLFERVVVRYSDARGIARYEQRYVFNFDVGPQYTSGGKHMEEKRIF
jgi:hypothetical protein